MAQKISQISDNIFKNFLKEQLMGMYKIQFFTMTDEEHIKQLQKSARVDIDSKGYDYQIKNQLQYRLEEYFFEDDRLAGTGFGLCLKKFKGNLSDVLFIIPFSRLKSYESDSTTFSIYCTDKDELNKVRKELEKKYGMLFDKATRCDSEEQNALYYFIIESNYDDTNNFSYIDLEIDLSMGEYMSNREVCGDLVVEVEDIFFKRDRSDYFGFDDDDTTTMFVKDYVAFRFNLVGKNRIMITLSSPVLSQNALRKYTEKVEEAIIKYFQNNNFSFYSYEIQ